MGPSGLNGFDVQAHEPVFYGLGPLARQLISATAAIMSYVPGVGLTGPMREKGFVSVDLETWMQRCLSTMDLALTPSYAPAMAIMPGGTANPFSTS